MAYPENRWKDYSAYSEHYHKNVDRKREITHSVERIKLFILVVFASIAISAFLIAIGGLTGLVVFESSSYSGGSQHIGLSGGLPSSSNLDARFTLTHEQPGNPNMTSNVSQGNLGWLSIFNRVPVIESISLESSSYDPTEYGIEEINMSFIAFDPDGYGDLNESLAMAKFENGGEMRNASCMKANHIRFYRTNFSCSIGMWYFDSAGVWNATALISDSLNTTANSTQFTYNSLLAMQMSPDAITFPPMNPGAISMPASNHTTINNTGNVDIINITLQAFNILGMTNSSNYIPAANFSAGISTGGSPSAECLGDRMKNATSVKITGASVPRGNLSAGGGQGSLYYCLTEVPESLPKQGYSSGANPWYVHVAAMLTVMALRRKKKDLIDELDEGLKERYGIGLDEIASMLKKSKQKEEMGEEMTVPVSIFKNKDVGPAATLVKYMKENRNMRLSKIARMLNRDDRTIWHEYRLSSGIRGLEEKEGPNIPIEIFKERKFSILESLIFYLRENGRSNIEIANMLGRDPRNIYTIYSRALLKLKASK